MGPRVEACRFQVTMHVGDDRVGVGGQRDRRMAHDAIDVVHPEPDAFEVERGDGSQERLCFLNEARKLILVRRQSAQQRDEIGEAALRRLAFVGGHDAMILDWPGCASTIPHAVPDKVMRS